MVAEIFKSFKKIKDITAQSQKSAEVINKCFLTSPSPLPKSQIRSSPVQSPHDGLHGAGVFVAHHPAVLVPDLLGEVPSRLQCGAKQHTV